MMARRHVLSLCALFFVAFAGVGANSCVAVPVAAAATPHFEVINLVSDLPGVAENTDPNLVNPWGVAFNPTHPFWVADNHTGLATLYNQEGVPQDLVVDIPGPGGVGSGAPTGVVFNRTSGFRRAPFIFATEDGTIAAWNGGTSATIVADKSATEEVYKGLALSRVPQSSRLYATDFRHAKIDVYNKVFHRINLGRRAFRDPQAPSGFAPFNIADIDGRLYVTYAEQDEDRTDDVGGVGSGFIDIFLPNGQFVRRLISGTEVGGQVPELNSPWGLAIAPSSFGRFAGALLVGNFKSGEILAINARTGAVLGLLTDVNGDPIVIDGLWSLIPGGGGASGDRNKIYFTAGPDDETHGLFGVIQVAE